jgi:conjugal transfer pilus assembly protein TraD
MGIESKVKKVLLPSVWRHSYEFYSATFALLGLIYYGYLYFQGELNGGGQYSGLFWIIPAVLVFMLAIRVKSGIKMWFRRVRLYGKALDFWSEKKKLQRFNAKQGYITLGDGFDWKNEHTQAAYEAKKLDMDKVKPSKLAFWVYQLIKREKLRYLKNPEDREKGKGWIHGLSDDISPLMLAIKDLADGFMIVGTTGAGKTRLLELLISQNIHRKPLETCICVDPKIDKDLYPRMMYECAQAGRPDDFLFFSLAHPTYSIGINPIHNYSEPTDVATRLMSIIPEAANKMDSFQAFTWAKIVTVVSVYELIGRRPTINNIFSVIESNPDELTKEAILYYAEDNQIPSWATAYDQYVKQVTNDTAGMYRRPSMSTPDDVVAAVVLYEQHIKRVKESNVLNALVDYFYHDRTHFQKMIASVVPFFTALRAGEVGKILSPDLDDNPNRPWWDMSKVVMANKVLYIGTNAMGNQSVSDAVAGMLVADLNEVSASRYNYEFTGEHYINLDVDESASLVTPSFISLLNKARGSFIRTRFCTQVLPDFVVRLGTEAAKDQVVGNANQVLALRVKDQSTKEYLSAEMGEAVLTTTQTSQSTTPMSSDKDITNFSGSYGERTTETEVPKISPSLLGELPNLEFVANISGGRIVKGKVPILDKPPGGLPTFKDIPWVKDARLM